MKRTVVAGLAIAAMVAPAWGQDMAARTAELNAQADLAKAEAAKITAQADLARMRIEALGLPKFEDKTTLENDAGKMETMQMASHALAVAAGAIARTTTADLKTGQHLVLLTMDEPFDLSFADSVDQEMTALSTALSGAIKAAQDNKRPLKTADAKDGEPAADAGRDLVGAGAAGAIAAGTNPVAFGVAAIGAVAGLVRTTTTINGFGISEMNDAMLVRAIAQQKPAAFLLPEALITVPKDARLPKLLADTAVINDTARRARAGIVAAADGKPSKKATELFDALDLAIKRFEAFHIRMTTPGATGRLPIVDAARLDALRGDDILRVHVDWAGGSLLNRQNIATFFGADPIKVTAGLVVSYIVTAPGTGETRRSGFMTCRTAMARLRSVQEDTYRVRAGGKDTAERATCSML